MKKRSISIHGHPTSVALEPEFWVEIDKAAQQDDLSVSSLIRQLDDTRLIETPEQGLASYIRVWVLKRVTSDPSREA
ncbi:MAG: ribbon-helix-helix domain-containing protein [Pseudomonadota bacterium]